jgi:hypothetical protein
MRELCQLHYVFTYTHTHTHVHRASMANSKSQLCEDTRARYYRACAICTQTKSCIEMSNVEISLWTWYVCVCVYVCMYVQNPASRCQMWKYPLRRGTYEYVCMFACMYVKNPASRCHVWKHPLRRDTCVYVCMCVCTKSSCIWYVCIGTYVCVCLHVCTKSSCIWYVCVCIATYVYVYVCMYVQNHRASGMYVYV